MSACCGEQVVLAQQLIEPLHIFEGRLRRGNRVGIKTFACRKRFSTLKRGEGGISNAVDFEILPLSPAAPTTRPIWHPALCCE